MKKKIYLYPIKANKKIFNPYVTYFGKSLSEKYEIANKEGANYGIFDLFFYLKCDVFVFNWTENLPKLRFGFLQTITYVINILILKLLKSKRIIWIFHNKKSHNEKKNLSDFLLFFNSHIADLVITHAKDGLHYYKEKFRKDNIVYTPHPIYENVYPLLNVPIIYDFILWGNIEPYKNITSFLKFVSKDKYFSEKKILICGKCNNESYLTEIKELLTPNITLIKEYLDDNKLVRLISESNVIIFSHASSSILSSGTLVYSLSFLKPIIGPNTGAFKDYKECGLIETYKEFNEIEDLIHNFNPDVKNILNHLNKYTWDNFAKLLINFIEK